MILGDCRVHRYPGPRLWVPLLFVGCASGQVPHDELSAHTESQRPPMVEALDDHTLRVRDGTLSGGRTDVSLESGRMDANGVVHPSPSLGEPNPSLGMPNPYEARGIDGAEHLGDLTFGIVTSSKISRRPRSQLVLRSGNIAIPLRTFSSRGTEHIVAVHVSPSGQHLVVETANKTRGSWTIVYRPRAAAALLNRHGLARIADGLLERAQRLLELAVRTDDSFADAYYNLACVHARQNRWDIARRLALAAVAKDPIRLGIVLQRDRDLAEIAQDPDILRAIGRSHLIGQEN